jgi:hypothetical protein
MNKIRAVLDQIEAEQRQSTVCDIPDNIPLSELAEQVVRGKVKLSPPQLRMLIELLPFHLPKLSAVGVGFMTNDTFAERLDRAIDASEKAKRFTKLIELSAATLKNSDGERGDQ